jgi:membrane protein
VRQKLFALGMLGIVLMFIAASVLVPTLQSILSAGTTRLPFGLDKVHGLVYTLTLAAGVAVLFAVLCATYWLVPKGPIGWRAVWPGALGATFAMAVVDLGFPLYLENVSALRIGSSAVFVLIALVWFYAMAIIVLAGAVVNELRVERAQGRPQAADQAG